MGLVLATLANLSNFPLYVVACVCAVLGYIGFLVLAGSKSNKGGIPSIAPRWQEWLCVTGYGKILERVVEGSRKYPNACFRMPVFPLGNVIILNGTKWASEIRNAPDETLSFTEFAEKLIKARYTMGLALNEDPYHLPIIRTTLTRNLGVLFPDIIEEMQLSFEDAFDSCADWEQFQLHSTLMKIVCRTSNRVIVGPDLCRNPNFQRINVEHTIDVSKSAFFISLFPEFLQPLIGPLLSRQRYYTRTTINILRDEIKSRQNNLEKYGSGWAEKPNDFLMWLIESAPTAYEEDIIARILEVEFAAIHTSSLTFTHALLHLAAHIEFVQPLREEVEHIVKEEGWTKASMQKMRKVDSFLKESSRLNSLGLISLGRVALKNYTLSDGIKVPKGSMVAVSTYCAHMNDANHANAEEFNPFRFSNMRDVDGEGTKHQMVATSPDYLPFGLGRHACPGRFFAANEIKAMFCYVLMNYDIKLPGGSTKRPPNRYFGGAVMPGKKDEVLVRKRNIQ